MERGGKSDLSEGVLSDGRISASSFSADSQTAGNRGVLICSQEKEVKIPLKSLENIRKSDV